MQQLLCLSVNQRAISALLTPFYFLFQSKKLLLRFAMLVMSIGMMSGVVGQATVTSDKDDYAPLSNAVFTGAGFNPFEQVVLKVKNLSQPCNTVSADSSYYPWTVTADANGAFVTNWTVCDCNGDSLRLKATGQTSGLIAYDYFTDSAPWTLTVASSTTPVCVGSPQVLTFTARSTGNGSGSVGCIKIDIPTDFTITGIPSISSAPDGVLSWNIGYIGSVLTVNATNNNARLMNGETLVFTLPVVATASSGSPYEWTANGSENTNCTVGAANPNPTTQPSVSVSANHTISLNAGSNNTQTVCQNTAISNIVYTIGGGANNASVSGLPTGVIGTYSGGTFTISGTPSVSGTFNYTVTTSGNGCTVQQATGMITVTSIIDYANLQFPGTSTICQGASLTAYGQVYEPGVTPGAGLQGAGIVAQFGYHSANTDPSTWPAGNWSTASFNASGGGPNNDEYQYTFTPPSTGTYYYTFRYSLNGCTYQYGGYPNGFWNGTTQNSGVLTVNSAHTLLHNSGSTTQSICEGLPIESIVYTFGGGATGVNVSGLPAGVNASTVGNTVTISGTPTVSFGTFNYTVTTTGNSCTAQSLGGTITVKSKLDVINLDPPLTPTICFGNSYTAYSEVYEPGVTPGTGPASPNIISEFGYGTTNNVASFTWATASFNGPASLYNFDGYMYTFTPAAAGTYYYTFRYSFNGCDWQYTPQVGTLTVDAPHTLSLTSGDNTQEPCEGTSISDIKYTFGGGATGVNVSGLPAGVSSSITGNVLTITGTPTVQFGTYNYTVTTTGGSCATQSLGGTITVKSKLDYVNLQFPLTDTKCLGQSLTAYGQVYEPGVTPGAGAASPNIIAEYGYGTVNNTSSFTWATASFNAAGSTGNNDEYQYVFTPTATGTYYYTFRYSFNGCDWQYASDIGVLTVNEAPAITTVYNNITVNNDPGVCGAVVTYAAASATGIPAPGITYSHASGSVFPVGITTVTVTATNSCGTDTKTFTVTVNDTENPTIVNLPLNITKSNDAGVCGAVVTWTAPTSADNCSGHSIAQTAGPASGSTFPVGTTTVTYTATDAAGNTYSASFTVTVNDTENPTIVNLPLNITQSNDAGVCGAVVTWTAPTSADNCSGHSIVQTAGPASGSTFPVGTTTVTYTATDAAGNTYSASFTVTVNDTENPTIVNLPLNITQSNDAGVCGAVVTWTAPTSADNCSGSTIAQTAGPASGSTFPVGTTTVTYTATDAAGNTYSASFTVTVNDTENPTIVNLPLNITQSNDAGVCGAVVTWVAPTSADNCSGSTIAQTAGPASGSTFPVGTTTVTYTATDAAGNTYSASFTVTVNDTENPTIVNLPLNITKSNDAGVCGAVVTWTAPTSADNCSGSTIAQTAGPASGSTFPVGTTTVTYTATDAAGNTYSASFTVTVNDTEAPVISGTPSTVTVYTGVGRTSCDQTATWTVPTASDNCPGVVSVSSTHNPGDVFPVGNTTVTYTFTDANNNSSQTSFTVTVIDNTAPVWTTTAGTLNRTIYCGQSSLLANAQALTPVATDNCGGTITVTKIAGAFVPLGGGGSYTNTWTAIDAAGNISTIFTQVITVDAITVDASTSSTPVPLGTAAILSATVSPAASGITVVFTLDDGNGNIYTYSGVTDAFGKVTASTASNLPLEVYKITAVAGSGCATSIAYLPIYDPNGNFVTGGGWINSPAGALTADPLIVGKANFGFVSKYKKGSSIVDGNTEFQFHAGDINFKSTMHESGSLVISGAKATYRGTGTINGLAGYKFTIVAIDGNWNNGVAPDKFRIKITTTTGQVVYDNQMGKDDNADDATVLGGGSIVIHEVKKKTANRMEPGVLVLTPQEFGVKVIGNPSITTFRLQLQSNDMQEKFTVKVVDINGRLIEVQQNLYAGQVIELGSKYTQGTYFAEVMQGTNRKVVKLIKIGRN